MFTFQCTHEWPGLVDLGYEHTQKHFSRMQNFVANQLLCDTYLSDVCGGLAQLVASLIASPKLINTRHGYYLDG